MFDCAIPTTPQTKKLIIVCRILCRDCAYQIIS